MKLKREDSMDFSFKNPFDDFNANILNPEQIMQYWYTPFATGALKEFDEKKFFAQKMPIILQGSRGSGKTTILKYFSFPVQKERANQRNLTIKEQLSEHVCIAPLSTKPVALGICMYALAHKNLRVVYPMSDQYNYHRTNRVLRTFIYRVPLDKIRDI